MRKHLFKPLLTLALVLVCGNVWGETKTIIVDGSKLTSTATTSVSTLTFGDVDFMFSPGAKYQNSSAATNSFSESASILIGKSGAYIYNSSPIPGKITNFEIYSNYGASTNVSVGVNFSVNPISSFNAEASNTYAVKLSTANSVYDCSANLPENAHYFWYQVTNNYNSQVQFRITYEDSEDIIPTKTLSSIAISGDATKKAYFEGEAFSTDGLTVTGTYDDGSQQAISAGITWTVTPETLTTSTNSVSVKAKVGEKESAAYSVNGITVKTIANTAETAYTVAEAKALIDANPSSLSTTKVYVKGKISKIDSYNSTYKSITYWISEDGTTTDQFEVYSGKNLDETDFSSKDDLVLGSNVVVCGIIKKYNSTYEFDKNNYLVSYTAAVPEKYTLHITQPKDGGTLTVKNGETALTDGCEVTVGTKLTCEVTDVPEGKRFSRFYINYDNDGEKYKTTNPATFDNLPIEGITEATVTVKYQDLEKYTITLFDKSEKTVIADVFEGSVISEVVRSYNPAETVDDFTFCGWSYTHNVDAVKLVKAEDVLKSDIELYAAYGQTEGTEATWELISSMDDFKAGYEVAIVGAYTDKEGNTSYYAMGEQRSNNRAGVEVSLNSNAAIMADGVESFVVEEGTKEGTFALKSSDGYLYAASTSSNYLKSQKANDDNGLWAIAITSGTASVVAQGKNTRNVMQFNYNGGSPIFSCYGSASQQAVSLYKKNGGFSTTYSFCEPAGYMVTISSVGYATFSSNSESVGEAVIIPEGVKAYTATYANKVVTLNEIEGGIIPAGEGVVLEGEPGTYFLEKTTSMGASADNDLQATGSSELTYEEIIEGAEEYVYTLNNGSKGVNFYRMNEESKLGANKAYLRIAKAEFADEESSISMRFGGDATLIESINIVESNTYFDLQGRKVENPTNGLYIINGQKVLVK